MLKVVSTQIWYYTVLIVVLKFPSVTITEMVTEAVKCQLFRLVVKSYALQQALKPKEFMSDSH